MTGIADVARLAGVSKSTASRALTGAGYVSDDTRRRVSEAAASLGYVPSTSAVSLATGRLQTIGVLVPALTPWFYAEVVQGINAAALECGFDLTLYEARPGSDQRRRVLADVLPRRRFDGLIAVGLEPQDGELPALRALGRPLVRVVGRTGDTSVVSIDDPHAARRATEHLLTLGHRSIAFLGGGIDVHGAYVEGLRLRGYADAMAEAGAADRARHVRSAVSLPGGYAAAVDLLGDARDRPTALVAVSDEVAIGAIIAARRLGIPVPGELSVVGIDDHLYAEMFSLTTLQQRPREHGARAVELLLAALADPGAGPVEISVQARMIVRSSTAPLDPSRAVVVSDTNLQRG
jgi:DNA-binding LacI/PurR family transcriptional regulator